MPEFESVPRRITAEQYRHPSMQPQGVCFCSAGQPQGGTEELESRAHVHTMHEGQIVILEPGDWIVPEPDGEHYYPIKPDIMEKNYRLIKGALS